MEFARYYDVSTLIRGMQEAREINHYPIGDEEFKGVYICMDSYDFWINRISEWYNEEYKRVYLIGKNRICIFDVMTRLYELHSEKIPKFEEKESLETRSKCRDYINQFDEKEICRAVVFLDDNSCLETCDCCETDSLEEAIEIIDGGSGVLTLTM